MSGMRGCPRRGRMKLGVKIKKDDCTKRFTTYVFADTMYPHDLIDRLDAKYPRIAGKFLVESIKKIKDRT